MKKIIISSVIFTLLICCFTLSAQENKTQVHDIDQKLSLKEQLATMKAGKNEPSKVSEIQDEKLTPEEREEIKINSKIPNPKYVDEIEVREESIATPQPPNTINQSNTTQPVPEAPANQQASSVNKGNIQPENQPVPEKKGTPTVFKKGPNTQPEGKPNGKPEKK